MSYFALLWLLLKTYSLPLCWGLLLSQFCLDGASDGADKGFKRLFMGSFLEQFLEGGVVRRMQK